MSLSVADIYENYLESKVSYRRRRERKPLLKLKNLLGLQNLPSEIDQNMHELRRMDDDLSSKMFILH